jgi:predicted CXXCH cytochrome family protein
MSKRRIAGASLRCIPVLLGSVSLAAAGGPPITYLAQPAATYEYHGEPALQMPTAVAVARSGNVFVVDGVNDRLLQFAPDGVFLSEIRRVGDETLLRPMSARFDAAGNLWIADTGHQRVVVRKGDGALQRVLPLEQGDAGHAPDITDVVPDTASALVWLVDNDNDRLVRWDPASGAFVPLGEHGNAMGQFQHPFMLAVGQGGAAFVTDVVNARVQVLGANGKPIGTVGTFGLDVGQLYRPTGIACDADGNVWVADFVLGAVQVFTPQGVFRDVIRAAEGRPLKLAGPMGIALGARGDLYVTELLANRVRRFSIKVDAAAPTPSGAPAPASQPSGKQARECTVCHLEWIPALADGRGTEVLEAPVGTAEEPVASRSVTCLSCHNGAVVDSRRRVWQEHGHGTDIAPSAGMTVPSNLPLVNGRVACRTCHSAHGTAEPNGDLRTAVFLRVPNTASELCMGCHPDKTRGPELGTHPTGGMPWPVPQAIVAAGGRIGPNPRELTCQVCHTPHGAAHDHLLVMGTESNQLCLTCHDSMRPGLFREGSAEHPLSPKTSPEQAAAVQELGTKLGPDGELICLSCHKLHHGRSKRYMLADELRDARLCLRCHSERRNLLGTSHDLRTNHPTEKNRLGMTPEDSGPCSACHLFHRYARPPEASDLDPGGGKCITCHQSDRVASAKALGDLNHPPIGCTNCHNPHETRYGKYLLSVPSDICRRCHTANLGVRDGPHDVTCGRGPWPAESAATHDTCMACHRPHGNLETSLFRAGLAPGEKPPDAMCLACHQNVAPDANSERSLQHPRDVVRQKAGASPAASVAVGDSLHVACRICHNPHAGIHAPRALLRVELGAPVNQVCMNCHTETVHLAATGHGLTPLQAAGLPTDACAPCHQVHACRDAVEPRYLWPRELSGEPSENLSLLEMDQHCLACHRDGGPAQPPAIARHPKVDMYNPTAPDSPGFLPLFNAQGEVDAQGKLGCHTCHLPHGRTTVARIPPGFGQPSGRELRARVWHIRTFAAGSVCGTCHGFDGLRRFMYFHDPERRTGPLNTVPRPAP